jgi:pimeloyl-ACP methyl ester carboxylesterase
MKTPDLLLLPGLHGTSELFARFVSAAPKGMRTIPVDYPANLSSFDDLEDIARDKLADPCIVLAESFSGPIGVRVASDDRVRALVLCGSFVRSPSRAGRFAIAPLFSIPFPAFVIQLLLSGRRADPSLVTGVQTALRRLPGSVVARRIQEVARAEESERVQSLRKPILYLRGTDDLLVSERSCKDLERIRPDARIVRISGPHMLLQVSPHECWRAILNFVEELGTNSP